MILTNEQKAKYWSILVSHCHQYVGSAGLGDKKYQHIGMIFGPNNTEIGSNAIVKYATTDAKSQDPHDLFDAVLNTQVVRAAWKVKGGGYYFEFWSAYQGVPHEKSENDRLTLIEFLDTL